MITTSVAERNHVHSAILRHLNIRSNIDKAARAEGLSHGGAECNTAREAPMDIAGAGLVLYNLLLKYVDLLEHDQHGGWTQKEDEVVLTVISALLSLGWDIRQPTIDCAIKEEAHRKD